MNVCSGMLGIIKEYPAFPQHSIWVQVHKVIAQMSVIRDPQADQLDQAVFLFPRAAPLKCMATGRIKSKTGRGPRPRLCTQLPEAHQPSPRWFFVTSCGKREGRQAWRFFLYVVEPPEPWNHSGKAGKTRLPWGSHWSWKGRKLNNSFNLCCCYYVGNP